MKKLLKDLRFTFAIGLALVAVGAGASFSLANSSSSSNPAIPAPSESSNIAVSSSLTDHFAVLREGTEAGDAGVTMFGHVGEGDAASYGIDPQAARSAPNSLSVPVWIIPGSNGACLYIVPSTEPGQPARVACGSASRALSGEILDLVTVHGKKMLFGLVPDGSVKVTIKNRDGTSKEAPVANNLYSVSEAQDASTVELRDQSGVSQTIEAP